MGHDPWEASNRSTCQEIPRLLWKPLLIPFLRQMNPVHTLSCVFIIQCVLHALTWAKNTVWIRPSLSVCRVFLGSRQISWPDVIVGTYCCDYGKTYHCWLITVASDHIIATMTLNNIIAFVVPFKYEWSKSTFPLSLHQRLLTSSPVMWLEEHLWNFSVLQRVHICSLVILSSRLRLSLQIQSGRCVEEKHFCPCRELSPGSPGP
jgi:hypothetical protein